MEFKLIVAGGRDFNDYDRLSVVIFELANGALRQHEVSIVSGMARGADALAVRFARQYDVQLYAKPADWTQGKGAGFIRNKEMGDMADGLLAFWDGKSSGTRQMIEYMCSLDKQVFIERY